MKITLNELKEIKFISEENRRGWFLTNGTEVPAFEPDGMSGETHQIIEGGTLSYEYGEGFVVTIDRKRTKLQDFINDINETIEEEVKEEITEEIKTLDQNQSFEIGDIVNINNKLLKVKNTGEYINDIDYGNMYKRIISYENSNIKTFNTKIFYKN